MFPFQIPFLSSLSSFRSREIVGICSTLPCDCFEFEAPRSSILDHHPLPSLTAAVAEFTSEETRLQMLSSLSAPVQSVSSPTALVEPYHPHTSHGPQSREPPFHGKMNRGQQPCGSSTQQVQCTFANNSAT